MIERRLRPESSAPPKQRRRGRSGWPLAEADKSAGIPEADRRAIQLAIAEWAVAPKEIPADAGPSRLRWWRSRAGEDE
jgi:hypothetical protein